jgi:hypothetical protein
MRTITIDLQDAVYGALEIEARGMRFSPAAFVRECAESALAARRLPFVSPARSARAVDDEPKTYAVRLPARSIK